MGDGNGTLMVKVPREGRGKFRVYTGRTVLDWAKAGGNTPFALASGTHRVQVRRGLDRSNTVAVDVPAGGRVQVELRDNRFAPLLWFVPLLVSLAARFVWHTDLLWPQLLGLPFPLLLCLPGGVFKLRVTEA